MGPVDTGHDEIRALIPQRERDRAAAGPPVEHRPALRRDLDRPLHEQLRLGPRHQHRRRHRQLDPAEPAAPDDVGHRLAGSPSRDERAVRVRLGCGEGTLVVGVERDPLDPEHGGQQHFGVQTWRVTSTVGKVPGGALEHLSDRQVSGQRRATASTNDLTGPCRNVLTSSTAASSAGRSSVMSRCEYTRRR